jgi:DNA-binding response OmpR family regulator
VLIVEDDEKVQDLIRTLLARHCTTMDVASDGERAIEMMRENTYDAVIVDIMLPRMNGLLVIEAIASLSYEPKVIVLSALSRHFHDRYPAGTLVLQKPFEIDKVAEAISSICAEASAK